MVKHTCRLVAEADICSIMKIATLDIHNYARSTYQWLLDGRLLIPHAEQYTHTLSLSSCLSA